MPWSSAAAAGPSPHYLRLRLENKLGFKMVKWIKAIELVEDYRTVFEGQGGYHEDRRYYGYHVNI